MARMALLRGRGWWWATMAVFTTKYGGASGKGTVFKITTNGMISALVSFTGTNGANPFARLTLGRDGGLYGTTSAGGTNQSPDGQGFGTVFKLSAGGSMTTVLSLNGTNGWSPRAGLVSDSDGNMFGATFNGGETYVPGVFIGYGVVFRLA